MIWREAMLKGKISPSLMCADITDIRSVLETFKKCGVEYLHIDVMDGVFVPNLMLSDGVMRQIRKFTDIPFDYHLMITDPETKIDWFDLKQSDIVSVHFESTPHIHRAVKKIKDCGAKAGVALNPATPIENIKYLLADLDMILVMTVDPGFAGQSIVGQTLRKIREAREYLDGSGYGNIMLEVDGCVSYENAKIMRKNGADVFVAGTSSVFGSGKLEDGLARLRGIIEQEAE